MHFLTGNKGEGCKPNSEIEGDAPVYLFGVEGPSFCGAESPVRARRVATDAIVFLHH